MATKQETAKKFETSLSKLESIVEKLETGDLPLNESLKAFEQGLKLAEQCQNTLKNAELKVTKLLGESSADSHETPFDEHDA